MPTPPSQPQGARSECKHVEVFLTVGGIWRCYDCEQLFIPKPLTSRGGESGTGECPKGQANSSPLASSDSLASASSKLSAYYCKKHHPTEGVFDSSTVSMNRCSVCGKQPTKSYEPPDTEESAPDLSEKINEGLDKLYGTPAPKEEMNDPSPQYPCHRCKELEAVIEQAGEALEKIADIEPKDRDDECMSDNWDDCRDFGWYECGRYASREAQQALSSLLPYRKKK